MSSELILITQLAIILIAASVFTVICRALKQPLILGYIIAGFIVGPHLGLFPQLDAASVNNWSQLGIVFLLFGLGLEFSFRKLIKIGSSALITSGVICLGMFAVGMILGRAMGWTQMEATFMGGLMSMSSTTIIIKSYNDMGLKNKPWSSLIFGTLVFEDLIAVLLMVLLSTMAMTGKFSGSEMFTSVLKLLFFLVLWFTVGIFLIPLVLKKAKKYLDDEILLLVGIGLCFLMVVLATKVGFSSALGAFVMGSILAETIEGEHIAKLTSSIKDLFGAIFFVSVGMMVDPGVIAGNWMAIIVITVVAMTGLLCFSTLGSILSGSGLDNAVHVGFSMAQLGEFSFIIAGLGTSMGVMRESIYPIIIAVSVITTFTTPYMIKAGDPVSRWLQKHLPASALEKLSPHSLSVESTAEGKSEWKTVLTHLAIRTVIYSVTIIAVIIAGGEFLPKLFNLLIPELNPTLCTLLTFGINILFLSPLIYGLVTNGSKTGALMDSLAQKNSDNRWFLRVFYFLRTSLAAVLLIAMVNNTFTLNPVLRFIVAILIIGLLILVTRHHNKKDSALEKMFLSNLNAKKENKEV